MMWGLFYLFAGGTALGRILSETGTAAYIAERLIPYAAGYGINLKTMLIKGFWASLLSLGAVILVGYLLAIYWPAFGTA